MLYKLTFLVRAKKEWENLDPQVREQFKKKLNARKYAPKVNQDKLCYGWQKEKMVISEVGK